MNVRKVLAGSMAAMAAGATVAFGAFAQSSDLGDFVDTSGSSPVPPWVIIGTGNGNAEYAKDVVGAADVAAGMAGFATKDKAVGGDAEVSVSGGVSLSTSNQKLFGGDSINAAKDTLTSEDLPTLLASGTFEDDNGDSFDYDQYIVMGSSVVTLSNSGGNDDILGEDPATLIQIGTSAASPAYTLRVVFNDDLNFSDSDVDGNEIDLFGTSWTISADSTATKLVVFGGANKQTLSEGESSSVTVGGVTYDVSLVGVSDADTAVVKVNDQSRSMDAGQSRKISGLEVFLDEVFFFGKEGQVSSAQLTFGSNEVTFEHGKKVTIGSGSDEDKITGTEVTFTQGSEGTSVFEVKVAADDADGDFAAEGLPFSDPVFGTFKLAFGGETPKVADRAMFKFDTSGKDKATLEMTDSKGVSKTIEWARDPATTTQGGKSSLELADGDSDEIYVLEGQNMTEDDFVIINQDDFSHMLELTEISTSTGDASDGELTFEDVFSGTTYTIDMTETGTDSGVFNGTKVIDGKTYYFWSKDESTDVVAVVWGTGASAPAAGVNVGSTRTIFPTLIAEKDAEIAFAYNLTSSDGVTNSWTGGIEVIGLEDTLYNGTNTITGTNIQYTYNNASSSAWFTIEAVPGPSVVILEEDGEDSTETDVKNAVVVQADDDSDGEIEIDTSTSTPILTDALGPSYIETSDSDVSIAADRYGVLVSKDVDGQGSATVYYPDQQVVLAVGIGSDPEFSVSGEGGTVKEAYQITTPVAKLASEISNPASLNRDVILMGGPCANALVATLMEVSTEWKPGEADHCGAPFEGLDTGIIKEYENAFESGQKALVIAGVTGDDTRSLAGMVLEGTLSYEA